MQPTHEDSSTKELLKDVAYIRSLIANVFFVGEANAGDRRWVLVDAGATPSGDRIARAAESRFGRGARPAAIVLTHGHFDHVGALGDLAARWDAPVYAHTLELPYLTGRSAYPPPDPTVGGGAMARLARFYPRGPIDLGTRVRALPEDGSVPDMPGWRWIHTPGHTAGHVSFFRDGDRALIGGDAVVTTKQESAFAVLWQRPEVHGPPAYYTTDWLAARRSAEALAALEPSLLATGHGPPMRGERMLRELRALAHDFGWRAVPSRGRYVREPAVADASGVVSVPPPVSDRFPAVVAGVAGLAVATATVVVVRRRAQRRAALVARARDLV